MKLYHTSNVVVKHPDISHSRAAVDFGRGFYLTTIREQAEKYGERFRLRGEPVILNTYQLDEGLMQKYIVKKFPVYSEDWLDYVSACRREEQVEKYDVVEGGIANDKVFRTLDLYWAGDINKQEALKRLKYEKPNHQICLLSQEVIDECLIFLSQKELK